MNNANGVNYREQIQNNHEDILELLKNLISEKSIKNNEKSIDNCYQIVLSYLKNLPFEYEFSEEKKIKILDN